MKMVTRGRPRKDAIVLKVKAAKKSTRGRKRGGTNKVKIVNLAERLDRIEAALKRLTKPFKKKTGTHN